MAAVKFISTSFDKLNEIPVASGQIIFVQDQRAMYLDTDERTSYQQIITLKTETQRQALQYPLKGFYFIADTCILWSYGEDGWQAITSTPDEKIIFGSYDDFPQEGNPNVIYVDGTSMYRYVDGKYTLLNGSLNWGTFS